jgi:hypothetical protein
MLNFRLASFIGIEHGWVRIGPKQFLILSNNSTSDNLILEIDIVFVIFVDHGLEEFTDVISIQCRRLSSHS